MTTSEAPQPDPSTPEPVPVPTDAVPADEAVATPEPERGAVPQDAVPADAVPAVAAAQSAEAAATPEAGTVSEPDAVPTSEAVPVPQDAVPADAVPAVAAAQPAEAAATPEAEVGTEPEPVPVPTSAPASRDAVPGVAPDPRLLMAREAEPVTEPAAEEPAVAAGAPEPTLVLAAAEPAPAAPAAPAPPLPLGMVPPQPGVPHPYGEAVAPAAQAPTYWALPPQYAPKVRKERPWLRTFGRWATAVGVLAVVGSVTAALVAAPARTDIPGLKTPTDGRWSFPALTLPTLPPGNGPSDASAEHVHRVDLRSLLLPAPAGATVEAGLPGAGGWYPTSSLLGLFASSGLVQIKNALQDAGLRHVAATGWTMPDGTHTEIYLQQFRSSATATQADTAESISGYLSAAPDAVSGGAGDLGSLSSATVRSALAASGHPAVTYAYLPIGDTELLVVMSNPKRVPVVDFQQVMLLENRLLTA